MSDIEQVLERTDWLKQVAPYADAVVLAAAYRDLEARLDERQQVENACADALYEAEGNLAVAHTRIRELEAENERLRLKTGVPGCAICGKDAEWCDEHAERGRAEQAEARHAEALEVLRRYDPGCACGLCFDCEARRFLASHGRET